MHKPEAATNHRNGNSGKTVLTDDGPLRIEVPRDREGEFQPKLIGKHERRFTGFDDKIIALYARGMTVREIQGFLSEMYATDVTPEFISSVTDAVLAEVTTWQSRPLEPMYPVIFFDALRVKIREDNGAQQGGLPGPGRARRRQPRDPRAVDREHRGGEVLDEGVQRPEDARGGRHPDRGHRRTQGHGRGPGGGLPGHHAADLHRAPDPQQPDYANWKERRALAAAIKPIYQDRTQYQNARQNVQTHVRALCEILPPPYEGKGSQRRRGCRQQCPPRRTCRREMRSTRTRTAAPAAYDQSTNQAAATSSRSTYGRMPPCL